MRRRATLRPGRSAVLPAARMPRFAALLLDVAIAYTLFCVVPLLCVPDSSMAVFVLVLPVPGMLWEALWLRFTGATVGHWLSGIGLRWPGGAPPGYFTLCWRTVKRYIVFGMVADQPSNAVPGANLLGDVVRPIAFRSMSRLLDGNGIVASRRWSVAAMSGVFAVTLAVPAAGFATAELLEPPPLCTVKGTVGDRDEDLTIMNPEPEVLTPRDEVDREHDWFECPPHRMRAPLIIASVLWSIGAMVNATSVVDARRTRRLSAHHHGPAHGWRITRPGIPGADLAAKASRPLDSG